MNPFVADSDWGIWIILYFYLGGIAAGAYFVATLVALVGREEDRTVSRIGYRLALALVSVCGILLIVDLERPERFWHMLLQSEVVERALAEGWPAGGWATMLTAPMFKRWSPMSVGAWALLLFGACSTLSCAGTVWPGGRLERWLLHGAFGCVLQVFGSAVGFFVGSYTGVLLTASNQPVWSLSDWIGPLFLTSAASTGIASVLLLARWRGACPTVTLERLERADLWAISLELFVFIMFLASLQGMLPLALGAITGWVMVFGTLLLGLLAPLWLHLRAGRGEPRRMAMAAASALIGGLALRVGILKTAPALLKSWPESTGAATPGPLLQSITGVLLLLVTLNLGIAIPLALRRQWRLTPRQTASAAVASVVACVAVAWNFAEPATTWPTLARVGIPGFSPEDERERGGGPGASAVNHPDAAELRLRSKITGDLPNEP